MATYSKAYYAKEIKRVSPCRISQLISQKRLITTIENGRTVIVDCEHNDLCFGRVAWNSKRRKKRSIGFPI